MLTREETKPLKAYIAQDEYEGEVVFAKSKLDAQHSTDMDVRRASQYDAYAPLGVVPPRVLIADGWHLSCHNPKCRNMVQEGGEFYNEETEEYEEVMPVFVGKATYCTPACNDAANLDAILRLKIAAELREGLLAGWPGVTPGACAVLNTPPFIYFRFPGAKCDATWTLGADHVKIMAIDSEAYAAYKESSPTLPATKKGESPSHE